MRGKATWLITAAVGAVLIVGVVDALRGSSSHDESAHAAQAPTVVDLGGSTLTLESVTAQATTEPVATTEPAAIVEPVDATAPERLPSCETEQLRLTFTISDGLATPVLRRVKGQPCHHGRALIGFKVRDQSGDRVAAFGTSTRTTQPADFSDGFEQLVEMPQLSCDPAGSFLVVATVGPYVVRRPLPGAELPCNHG